MNGRGRKFSPLSTVALSRVIWVLLMVFTAKPAMADDGASLATRALDVFTLDRAVEFLSGLDSSEAAYLRARIAMYRGDCEAAALELSRYEAAHDAALELLNVAARCHGATAGAAGYVETDQGIEVRLQDAADQVLVPRIVEVAVATRDALQKELGVELERPIRIDVVRDHYSLSGMTGLPLKAAETTGTVGIARFGRVILLTPRAPFHGYPWEDTLAHELTHVLVSQLSGDRAPLWIQEGLAKRYESVWRSSHPFESTESAEAIARKAMAEGTTVGIDRIGPSIAMLPSPEAAKISFAEVRSFMDFWVRENGAAALRLLLSDMASHTPDEALRLVTGYPLDVWDARWQRWLSKQPLAEALAESQAGDRGEAVRRSRLGELLLEVRAYSAAAEQLDRALMAAPGDTQARELMGQAAVANGHRETARKLALDTHFEGVPNAKWLAFHAKYLAEAGEIERAVRALVQARSVDPLSEEIACASISARVENSTHKPFQDAICEEAKRLRQY